MENKTETVAVAVAEETRIPCEVFTRVCGYYRPVNNFNAGKVSEYADRTDFDLAKSAPKDLEKLQNILHGLEHCGGVLLVTADNCSGCGDLKRFLNSAEVEPKPVAVHEIKRLDRFILNEVAAYFGHSLADASSLPIVLTKDTMLHGEMADLHQRLLDVLKANSSFD